MRRKGHHNEASQGTNKPEPTGPETTGEKKRGVTLVMVRVYWLYHNKYKAYSIYLIYRTEDTSTTASVPYIYLGEKSQNNGWTNIIL